MTSNLVFREDNAEGYSRDQLAWLNSQWDVNYSDIDPDSAVGECLRKSLFKSLELAEREIVEAVARRVVQGWEQDI